MPHDDQDELFTLVDSNDKVLGSISRRQAHHDPTLIHRAVDVLVFNDQNEILLQKGVTTKTPIAALGPFLLQATLHILKPTKKRPSENSKKSLV